MNELARTCAQLSRENAELRSQVSELWAEMPPAAAPAQAPVLAQLPTDTEAGTGQPRTTATREPAGRPEGAGGARISRRAVGMALAGAAAGAVAATVIVERDPRGAAPAPSGESAGGAQLAAAEQAATATPTSTGSIINTSLSTASPVIAGTNTSTGAGVYGGSTSTGAGVYGVNASTGPGVQGKSSHGRGGIFAGSGAAQIQLTPGGSSHPTSGQRGDLYADSSGRLWYCKTTGTTATWHQIA